MVVLATVDYLQVRSQKRREATRLQESRWVNRPDMVVELVQPTLSRLTR